VRKCLREGDTVAATEALSKARALAQVTEPPLIPESELDELQTMIATMPPEALQVLRHGLASPFSALGVERLAQARVLNVVNRRQLLKKYRKLALTLHPDRCKHAMASDAMQVLNAAYDRLAGKAQPQGAQPRKRPRA
jgi:hypothetical protein